MSTEILTSGLCFGEGPRWHNGALWLSDMHALQVIRISRTGTVEPIVDVPNRPSGLGWLPNGELLVVSMRDRKILRWNGAELSTHADLAGLASFDCNDMVVDAKGRAYVGNFGFDLHAKEAPRPAELICVEPSGSARVVADDLAFPNGTVISADGSTLIVAESWGRRLTAFNIDAAGDLGNRRTWAELPDGAVPDGICLDCEGGIWSASPTSNECVRQLQGGEVTHRFPVDQGAYACALGGTEGDTLFILTAGSSDPEECRRERSGRIETIAAPFAHAGYP
jgi:sugar lactone lactonase YvrE